MSQRSRPNKKTTLRTTPLLYGVYLLRSIPRPGSFYIGSTPSPHRRLRQHNGDLKAGGAYRTKREGCRPWEMVMYIYGFPSKQAALAFEHAWQHCYQTRHIPTDQRIVKNKTGGRSLVHKIANARLLMKAMFFNRMALKIRLFNSEAYKVWLDNRFGISVRTELGAVTWDECKGGKDEEEGGNVKRVKEFQEEVEKNDMKHIQDFKGVLMRDKLSCSICKGKIDYIDTDSYELVSICHHVGCKNLTHLGCLRTYFRKQLQSSLPPPQSSSSSSSKSSDKNRAFEIPESDLIPYKGKCPGCRLVMIWADVVRNSTRIRSVLGYEGKEPSITDEEEDEFEKERENLLLS